MLRFVVRRLVLLIPILLGLSILVFVWIRALPGSPAQALLGERATPATIHQINHQYGLDRPIYVQYWRYLKETAQLQLGTSITSAQPVLTEIGQRFPATVELSVAAALFSILIGIPLGFFAAKKHGRLFDQVSLGVSLLRDLDPDLLPRPDPQVHLRRAAGLAPDGGSDLGVDQHPAPDELLSAGRAARRRPRCVLGRRAAPDPAGGRARLDPARGDHEDHPRRSARRAERGLHPHRAREGAPAAGRRPPARAAKRAAARVDDRRPAGRPAPLRRDPDRDGLRVPRDRLLASPGDQRPQLSGDPGRDSLRRDHRGVRQPARRHLVRADQSAHQAGRGVAACRSPSSSRER